MKRKKNKKEKKYSWVVCTHKDHPECKTCPHAQPHQFLVEDTDDEIVSCSGDCLALGEHVHCVPIQV